MRIFRKTDVQYFAFFFIALLFVGTSAFSQQADLVRYVQPFSGTAASTTKASEHVEDKTERLANTIPAVGLPFGMTQWTPQTQITEQKCLAPYYYNNKKIYGFRGTHWISGSCTQDYGSFTVMPISGKLRTLWKDYGTDYSHDGEVASPAYYKTQLKKYNLTVEMTSSLRCAMLRITATKADSIYLLITPNSDRQKGYIKIDRAKGEISGYNPAYRLYQGLGQPAGFSGYFFIKIKKTILTSGTFSAGQLYKDQILSNKKDIGAYAGFKLKKGEQLLLSCGTSFTSIAEAKKNLNAEINAKNFNELKAKATATWEASLAQVKLQDKNERSKRIFYTTLYHAQQHPRLFSDVSGAYPEFAGNKQTKRLKGADYYDDFSMWDIYRAQLPLMELLKPKLTGAFVNSLVLKGQQGNWLPIFPCWNSYTSAMIGDHTTAFIISAYNKGIRSFDVNEAYRLMRKNAFEVPDDADYLQGKGRRGISSYLKYGYIPLEDSVPNAFHKKEQVSRTLEYAYDDYALSTMAKDLKKTADFIELEQRSKNYKHVFDTSVGMVRGKFADGSWYKPFYPDHRESYITEGTPRQYSLYVPQDIPGLTAILGGKKNLENQLDSLFEKNQYWHGNEPGHQIPFMYNFTAAPWKTQRAVAKLLDEEYDDGPGGLSGNDDAGQMSAWYVFSALGFYPVDPVSGNYQLSTPLFEQATLKLESGVLLKITTVKTTDNAGYISKVLLNGKALSKPEISHADLLKGGTLTFYLQEKIPESNPFNKR
ncbi:GH92 family glycosyl hydrolase [Pedobacter sp. Leaf194]|uniref:GH92 family glycosyl hydrolase n=1 Tax=Pedobacter sp. Leaf194 TaxID=1736297 RepID=UPI000703AC88|nr:GH92 family glycosyl hydrolase [Pedobacter sp. Leaf194]KQS36080.1 alpha-mannosidase [Pedobacter sp. Leaf194]